jgi:hypothetical protein
MEVFPNSGIPEQNVQETAAALGVFGLEGDEDD